MLHLPPGGHPPGLRRKRGAHLITEVEKKEARPHKSNIFTLSPGGSKAFRCILKMVHLKCLQAQVSSLSPSLHTQALKWWRLKANGSFCCLLHESVAICQENPKQLQCKMEPRYIDWHCKNFRHLNGNPTCKD